MSLMQAVVTDSSPLIYLSRLESAGLLKALFDLIVIPEAVWLEITIAGRGLPEADFVMQGVKEGWIQRARMQDSDLPARCPQQLGRGEIEAIAIAAQLRGMLLTDDADARLFAESLGISVMGMLGILTKAKRCGHIREIRPLLQKLRSETNFRITQSLYEKILELNGETVS